jgi:hypothetical protein
VGLSFNFISRVHELGSAGRKPSRSRSRDRRSKIFPDSENRPPPL